MGRAIPVRANRGAVLEAADGLRVFITIHPSALLRLQDEDERRSAYASFVNDLARLSAWPRPDNTTAEPPFPRGARGCKAWRGGVVAADND